MPPAQLRETTMDPASRMLLRVTVAHPGNGLDDGAVRRSNKKTDALVESLMGRKPELRFRFIQENARFVRDVDV